jgi:Zn-dependent protease
MKTDYELFKVSGIPVSISLWFLLLLPLTGFNLPLVISIFIAVLGHELGHALTAKKLGYGSYGINIGFFAGTAQVDSNMHPRDNIKVVAAGPLVNLALGLLTINFGLEHFTYVNLFLFIFNILPVYPMDGGHLLKDILMLNMRDRRKAFGLSMSISSVVAIFSFITCVLASKFIIGIIFLVFFYYSIRELGYVK